jgi:hypothetical protein
MPHELIDALESWLIIWRQLLYALVDVLVLVILEFPEKYVSRFETGQTQDERIQVSDAAKD